VNAVSWRTGGAKSWIPRGDCPSDDVLDMATVEESEASSSNPSPRKLAPRGPIAWRLMCSMLFLLEGIRLPIGLYML